MSRQAAILLTLVVSILGYALGQAAAGTAEPKTITNTVTVTKTVTPQACLDAINYDNRIFTVISDAIKTDTQEGYNSAASEMNSLTPLRISAANECQSSIVKEN